nr:hypothetical protein [Tanacetum cinerariifolium]
MQRRTPRAFHQKISKNHPFERSSLVSFTLVDLRRVNAASTFVTAVGPNSTNTTNSFSTAGPYNTDVSPFLEIGGKSSFVDPSQYPDDPNMPALEDITYSDDEEDVGFEDPDYPNKVYKVVKALNGLHQAPRAWYETLANYLLENGFQMRKIDQTLFIKKQKIKQKQDGLFINQDKYIAEILRKFGLTYGKSASNPIDTEKPLLKDPDGEDVDVHIYRSIIGSLMYLTSSRQDIMFAFCECDHFQVTPKALHLHAVKKIFSDYAGASLDRKSTTGGCQFLGCRLIPWQCKKQTVVATSSTKAEYVATASCSAQKVDETDRIEIFVVDLKLLLSGDSLA